MEELLKKADKKIAELNLYTGEFKSSSGGSRITQTYLQISDPLTKQKHKIDSKMGQKILNNYISNYKGTL